MYVFVAILDICALIAGDYGPAGRMFVALSVAWVGELGLYLYARRHRDHE